MDSYVITHKKRNGEKTIERVYADGTRIDLDSMPVNGSPAQWSRWCDNYGCNPSQIPDLRKLLKDKGVQETQFDSTGAAYVESRQHGREIAKARGMVDYNAGMRG